MSRYTNEDIERFNAIGERLLELARAMSFAEGSVFEELCKEFDELYAQIPDDVPCPGGISYKYPGKPFKWGEYLDGECQLVYGSYRALAKDNSSQVTLNSNGEVLFYSSEVAPKTIAGAKWLCELVIRADMLDVYESPDK